MPSKTKDLKLTEDEITALDSCYDLFKNDGFMPALAQRKLIVKGLKKVLAAEKEGRHATNS